MERIYKMVNRHFMESELTQKEKISQQERLRQKAEQELIDTSLKWRRKVFAAVLQSGSYDVYDIFSLKPLHFPHLGISKLSKEGISGYLSFCDVEFNPCKLKGHRCEVSSSKTNSVVFHPHVDFSTCLKQGS